MALGSNGEYVSLDENESVEFVVHCVQKSHQQSRPLIAGTGCESTISTIRSGAIFHLKIFCKMPLSSRRCKALANVGADGFRVVTPHYFSKFATEEQLKHHFISIADNSPKPIIVYNVPFYTHLDLSLPILKQLALHPNIIGVKDSSGDAGRVLELSDACKGDSFAVLVGSAATLLPGLRNGAQGCISALANVLGHQIHSIYQV